MSLLQPNTPEPGPITAAEPGRVLSVHATPHLLERVIEAIEPEGSIALLVGEPGSGKSKIAQAAVEELGTKLGVEPATINLVAQSSPLAMIATTFGVNFSVAPGNRGTFVVQVEDEQLHNTVKLSQELLRTVTEAARSVNDGPVVVHVQGMDQYPQHLSLLVDALVHIPGVRVIAMARGLNGGAAHLAGNPRAHVVSVPPLTFEESQSYIARLLRVESVELHSLKRWFRVAEGNRLSMMLLTLALDREGRIGRSRGVAFELPGPETVPQEFWNQLSETCSDEELRTLETISLVEPLGESVLIRTLDPHSLSALRSRGLLKSQYRARRGSQLSLSHNLLAAGVRQQLSEERVREISGELFDVLRASASTSELYRQHSLLVRLVELGLNAQRTLPVDWLHEVLEAPADVTTPAKRLRIAQAMMQHPEISTTQFATAVLQIVLIARAEGENAVLERAWADVAEVLGKLRRSQAVSSMLRVRLELELAHHLAMDLGDISAALAIVRGLERDLDDELSPERAAVQSARVVLLAAAGELRQARDCLPNEASAASMPIEWELTGARLVSSLLLGQQGQFEAALRIADQTAAYALMGEHPQTDLARVVQFSSFMTFWACGATEAARFTLEGMTEASRHVTGYMGHVETASALMSLADGQWSLAVQLSERVVDRLQVHDPHRLLRLVYAALALGFAALGEKGASRRAIRAAEARSIGMSQMFLGYVRVLTLRARQWNHDEGTLESALQLAGWARTEELDVIEMLALHVVAIEERGDARAFLGRIRMLASEIEPPFSQAVLAHCEDLIAGVNSWENPAARALTSLGIWMPLPLTEELSAREREIALYASQGYSSRWIAEQFHLSVRTVDTHLRHVFSKLRVGGRDELRHWFRREHQTW